MAEVCPVFLVQVQDDINVLFNCFKFKSKMLKFDLITFRFITAF